MKKVSHALKETGGAATEYQHVVIELRALKNVLRQLEALEPTEHNAHYVNAIRGMALACQLPLREFLVKLDKYEASLSPFAEQKFYRGVGSKSQWATSFAAEVEQLRAVVAAKALSIQLLLTMHSSYGWIPFKHGGELICTLQTNCVTHRVQRGKRPHKSHHEGHRAPHCFTASSTSCHKDRR